MQPVDRASSAFSRSLPKPPQSVSLPVPPTIQSLPRSPKITSSPSLFAYAVARHVLPLGDVWTQPLIAGPSFASQFRKYCTLMGGGPPRSVQVWPLFETAAQLHGVPFALKRIARRGSYSLYS